MTESEKLCNEIGAKFFCKDYVYQGLKYRDEKNNKLELCDGLFEYSEMYMALQIKERSKETNGKTEESWLSDVVYGVAVNQILNTIKGIKNIEIEVRDLFQQRVLLHKDYSIYPVIVFKNNKIKEYEKVINVDGVKINIFSMNDYEKMMNAILHPFDIFYYLTQRANYITTSLPSIVISDINNIQAIANIGGEEDFANIIMYTKYKGDFSFKENALRILSIIENFRKKQSKVNPEYKNILNILQKIEPNCATGFMERFYYARIKAIEDKFDITKAIQLLIDDKKTDIVFCSIGKVPFKNPKNYEIICDAKQLQHKSDNMVLISFIGIDSDKFLIDWIYYEKQYEEDKEAYMCYDKLGLYDGRITRELFDEMCSNIDGLNDR